MQKEPNKMIKMPITGSSPPMPATRPYTSSFSNSNLAMTNDNTSFLYFPQNTSSLVTNGFAGDLLNNGTIISAPFNPTLLLHNFPRNYGSNFTDIYGLQVLLQ